MGNLFGTVGTKTYDALLADPMGAVRKAVAVAPGNGDIGKGVVLVKNSTTGLFAPATAQTLVAGSIAVILADDVSTGSSAAGTAGAATAYFRGQFMRGKVKLASGALSAAQIGILNGMGFLLDEVVPATGAEATLDNVVLETVATPTANPAAGEVASGTEVALATTTTGATIRYTLDGSTPTASSTEYTSPIALTTAKTIKAIAIKTGMYNSDVLTAAYTIAG